MKKSYFSNKLRNLKVSKILKEADFLLHTSQQMVSMLINNPEIDCCRRYNFAEKQENSVCYYYGVCFVLVIMVMTF